jgi:hypothetical protein
MTGFNMAAENPQTIVELVPPTIGANQTSVYTLPRNITSITISDVSLTLNVPDNVWPSGSTTLVAPNGDISIFKSGANFIIDNDTTVYTVVSFINGVVTFNPPTTLIHFSNESINVGNYPGDGKGTLATSSVSSLLIQTINLTNVNVHLYKVTSPKYIVIYAPIINYYNLLATGNAPAINGSLISPAEAGYYDPGGVVEPSGPLPGYIVLPFNNLQANPIYVEHERLYNAIANINLTSDYSIIILGFSTEQYFKTIDNSIPFSGFSQSNLTFIPSGSTYNLTEYNMNDLIVADSVFNPGSKGSLQPTLGGNVLNIYMGYPVINERFGTNPISGVELQMPPSPVFGNQILSAIGPSDVTVIPQIVKGITQYSSIAWRCFTFDLSIVNQTMAIGQAYSDWLTVESQQQWDSITANDTPAQLAIKILTDPRPVLPNPIPDQTTFQYTYGGGLRENYIKSFGLNYKYEGSSSQIDAAFLQKYIIDYFNPPG